MKTSNVLLILCVTFLLTSLLGLDDKLRLALLELAVSIATLIAIWQEHRGKH